MAVDFSVPGYTIIAKFREGGSAGIYKATKHPFKETVALKVLLPKHVGNRQMTKAFLLEAQFLEDVDHPNIIKFHCLVDDAPRPTIEMEFFVSDHVKWILKKKNEEGGFLEIPEGLRIMRDTVDALGYLHDLGIAHRDVKPENILIGKGGEVRLIDFSIAEKFKLGFFGKLFAGKPKVSGTLTYLAPEQLAQERADHRADFYSLGVVLYEVLTNGPPFRSTDPTSLARAHLQERPIPPKKHRDEITKELDEFVLRLLHKKPDRRPDSCAAILRELDKHIEDAKRIASYEKD